MLLLVAFFLTLAYYAILIGLDQKRKQLFALSQQVVLPMVDSVVDPLVEPATDSVTRSVGHSEIERSEKSDTATTANTVADSSKAINPNAVFGTLDDSKIMEHTIPDSTAIAIDHLVQTDKSAYKENLKINIPKLDTIPIANTVADTLTNHPKV